MKTPLSRSYARSRYPRLASRARSASLRRFGRGAGLFGKLGCVQCHNMNGFGAIAPIWAAWPTEFYARSLAATMWNHAPAMWGSMARGVRAGDMR